MSKWKNHDAVLRLSKKRTGYRNRFVVPMLSASLLGLATGAAAQPLEEQEGDGDYSPIEEIIVTAEKRQDNINDVPMSITALSGDRLIELGVSEVKDLAKFVPGFTFADSYTGTPIYTLRGIGFSDIALAGRSTVAIYSDEVPLPFAMETRGVNLDLERVEVLKGPQGTLFGQNATGGAINFIAAKPTDSFEAGIDATYGRFDEHLLSAFVSAPISDTLGVRVAVAHEGRGDWQRSYTTGEELGRVDFTNGRLILDWQPGSAFRASFTLTGYSDRSDMQAGQAVALSPALPPAVPLIPMVANYPLAPADARAADWIPGLDYGRKNEFYQASLRMEYDLSEDLTVTSISSHSEFDTNQLMNVPGVNFYNLLNTQLGSINSEYQEIRISGPIMGDGNFVIGVSGAWDDVASESIADFSESTQSFGFTGLGLPRFNTVRTIAEQDSETYAAFFNVDVPLTGALNVHAGARYTSSNIDFEGCSADTGDGNAALIFGTVQNALRAGAGLAPNPPIPAGGCITANALLQPVLVRSSLDEDNVSWRAGLKWKPAPQSLVYANVSKGYKAGSFPDLGAASASQFTPAVQESALAYEVGFKTSFLSRSFQLNGAAFYYDYSDKQVLGRILDPALGSLLQLVNVPESRIVGAELQAIWRPVEEFTLSLSGTYIDSKIQGSFVNFDPVGAVRDFGGEPFPNTPKWQIVADGEYKTSLNARIDGYLGAGLYHQSQTNSQLGELPQLDLRSYTLIDLRMGIETADGKWRFGVWAKNVGDSYYWNAANAAGDYIVRLAGMPATYGVTLTSRFR